jgi:plasmid stabilization system protein ParE
MPPTFRIILSAEAAADLQAIHDYVAHDSPQNAATLVGRILDSIDLLENFPYRTVPPRRSRKVKYPVRTLPVRPYVVYFRVIDDEQVVRILTVRHGARRPPKRLD